MKRIRHISGFRRHVEFSDRTSAKGAHRRGCTIEVGPTDKQCWPGIAHALHGVFYWNPVFSSLRLRWPQRSRLIVFEGRPRVSSRSSLLSTTQSPVVRSVSPPPRDRSNNNGMVEWLRWIGTRTVAPSAARLRLVVGDNWPFERQPVIYVRWSVDWAARHATLGFCRHFRHSQSLYAHVHDHFRFV